MPNEYSSRARRIAEERLPTILYYRFPGMNEKLELAITAITKDQSVFGPDDHEIIGKLLDEEFPFYLNTRDRKLDGQALQIEEDEVGSVARWLNNFFAYREVLEDLDPPSIAEIYFRIEKLRKKRLDTMGAEQDLHEFFNEEPALARFKHWLALAHWTADEAVALSLGKDPSVVNEASLRYPNGLSPFVREYKRRTDQLKRAQTAEQIDKILPTAVFLRWAINVAHWEIPFELQAAAKQVDLSQELDGKSKNTFYSVIVAMAICHYGLDPKTGGPFSSIGQAIADDMGEVGIKVSGRGIDDLLKRAFPALDDGRLKEPSRLWRERRKKMELP